MTPDDWGPPLRGGDGDRSWRDVLLGGPRRLGAWTLPLFIAVGLLGAVLAGSLAAVYYAQQVDDLEEQTAAARKDLTGAVEQVSEAAEEAIASIQREVNAVRDEFGVSLPIEDPAAKGMASVRTTVVVQRAQEPPPPGPGQTEPPPGQPAITEQRLGSAFAVVAAQGSTFFVTTFAMVDDPLRPGVPVERAEIAYGGNVVGAAVHSWDDDRDLALLRVDGLGRVPVAEWRPADEPIEAGGRLFVSGLLPTGTLTQFAATVGAVDPEAILTDAALADVLRGGPVFDAQGRVVAVASTAYRPFGEGGSSNPAVPIRLLCESLIRCGTDDLPTG